MASAGIRLRDVGHVFFGEMFVTPRDAPANLRAAIRHAVEIFRAINWRLQDATVTVFGNTPR